MQLKEINDDYTGSKAHQLIFEILQTLAIKKVIELQTVAIEVTGPLLFQLKDANFYFNTSISLTNINNIIQLVFSEYEIYDYDQICENIKVSSTDNDYLKNTLQALEKFKPTKTSADQFKIELGTGYDCYESILEILNCLMDRLLVPMVYHNELDFGTLTSLSYYNSHFILFETIQSIIEFNLTNLNAYIVNETLIEFNGEKEKANIRLCYTSIDNCILVLIFKNNKEFQEKIHRFLEYEEYDVFYNTFANQHGEIQITISPQNGEDLTPIIYEILDKIT
jgi:hypothetical protein